MEDDILGLLESDEKPFAPAAKTATEKSKINYWEETDIPARKVDVSALKHDQKAYGICVYIGRDKELSSDLKTKFIELAKVLNTKGYTFRHSGDSKDSMQNSILDLDDMKSESYLPWKKFNSDITTPTLAKPVGDAYEIAINSHKGYAKLPGAVRTILARDVHVTLGKDLVHPISFLLAYTDNGVESLDGKVDFKVTGNLAFYLKVAEDANVPVFNLKNSDAIKRLIDYIKSN